MPLPWVRLDTSFASNPKLLAMVQEKDGHRSAFVYLCGLGYSGVHGLAGFLPAECLPFIHGRAADADRLVRYEFWEKQRGGWLVHDWEQFQEANEETIRRRERAQSGAAARWEGHEARSDAERQRARRDRLKAAMEQNGDPDA